MFPDKKTLLLVDDDAIIALNQANNLNDAGYNVEIACSGQEAIDRVSKECIDLVLMGIDLGPGMNGTDVAREILKCCEIPIVFVSSHTEKDIVYKMNKYSHIIPT